MDMLLPLMLLWYTNLRGLNIFLEVAVQLSGNWRGVGEKYTMGA